MAWLPSAASIPKAVLASKHSWLHEMRWVFQSRACTKREGINKGGSGESSVTCVVMWPTTEYEIASLFSCKYIVRLTLNTLPPRPDQGTYDTTVLLHITINEHFSCWAIIVFTTFRLGCITRRSRLIYANRAATASSTEVNWLSSTPRLKKETHSLGMVKILPVKCTAWSSRAKKQ